MMIRSVTNRLHKDRSAVFYSVAAFSERNNNYCQVCSCLKATIDAAVSVLMCVLKKSYRKTWRMEHVHNVSSVASPCLVLKFWHDSIEYKSCAPTALARMFCSATTCSNFSRPHSLYANRMFCSVSDSVCPVFTCSWKSSKRLFITQCYFRFPTFLTVKMIMNLFHAIITILVRISSL